MARYANARIRIGRRRPPAILVLAVLAIAAWWSLQHDRQADAPPADLGAPAPPGSPADVLASLTVAAEQPMAGYDRERFGDDWASHAGGCDTRDLVLQRGEDVQVAPGCTVTAGRWTSLYDGASVTDPAKLDIDHVVPLAEAWRSGAAAWSPQQREAFANDLQSPQLVAVTASSNRAKGDQDPAHWRPQDRGYWCTYASNYVAVKARYGLTVDQAEHDALASMLANCR